jgi:hypothetical protein
MVLLWFAIRYVELVELTLQLPSFSVADALWNVRPCAARVHFTDFDSLHFSPVLRVPCPDLSLGP